MQLYVARWPDGTAMIVAADSMAEVANRLDEQGDPGACEVVPLEGPFAMVVRPTREPRGGFFLETSLDALDDAVDVERTIMRGAFPLLSESVERTRDDDREAHLSAQAWREAVARENARELAPSPAWADAIAEWWEEMSGETVDKSAAARQHMRITIPGEPEPAPSMRAHFDAEHQRIQERVAATLGPNAASAPAKKPTKPGPRPKKKPPRGPGSGRGT